ncbi:MAG TPA: hypothetical protein VFI80_11555 [Burkholderiales bacterium]|nr:hypothetical protein [Burkholderiales bacterium]
MRFQALAIATLVVLAGCHLRADAPTQAPDISSIAAGDGLAVLTWNDDPDLTYWIFYQAGGSVVAASPSSTAIRSVISPRLVTGLVNGTQYAFVMNATRDDSPAGPSSPVFTATPRLAGAGWVSGAPLGTVPQNLNAIAFSGTRFVVVGNAATIFAGDYNYANTNPVGVTTWLQPTPLPAGFASDLSAVLFNGSFVAMGTDGSILTSADGVNWTLATNPVPGAGMNGLAFGPGTYVAVGNGGEIFTSPDLVTWTPAANNAGTTGDLHNVSFLNGKFIATGALGTLLTSADGSNWTALTSNTPNALRAAAFGLTSQSVARYVAVGDAGTILTSTDGVQWNPVTPAPLAQNLNSVTVGSRFLAVGQGGVVAYSDDGTSWSTASAGSADLSRVLFAPGTYVAVGASGANVFAQ